MTSKILTYGFAISFFFLFVNVKKTSTDFHVKTMFAPLLKLLMSVSELTTLKYDTLA